MYRSIFTYPLTEEIILETLGSPDWTVFQFTLLSDGDSVLSSEKCVWNFGDSRKNVFDMYEDSCENLLKIFAVGARGKRRGF